jgi:hypothetical protein
MKQEPEANKTPHSGGWKAVLRTYPRILLVGSILFAVTGHLFFDDVRFDVYFADLLKPLCFGVLPHLISSARKHERHATPSDDEMKPALLVNMYSMNTTVHAPHSHSHTYTPIHNTQYTPTPYKHTCIQDPHDT